MIMSTSANRSRMPRTVKQIHFDIADGQDLHMCLFPIKRTGAGDHKLLGVEVALGDLQDRSGVTARTMSG